MPARVIAASKLLAFAANGALGGQVVIAAMKFMQFQLERPVIIGTPDSAVLPELLNDLTRLFS